MKRFIETNIFALLGFQLLSCSTQAQVDWVSFNDTVENLITEGVGAGAEVYIEKGGKVLLHKAYGFKDPERGVKSQLGDIYNIRSMTKPMAGAVAEILIDQGSISPSDLVSNYLPEFDKGKTKELTIEHLLLHRGGYVQGQPGRSWPNHESLEDMVDYWAENEPPGDIGGAWSYADAHADILGRVVEKVTGKSAQEVLNAYVIEPLSMDESFAAWTDDEALIDRIAPQIRGQQGDWRVVWRNEDYPWHNFAMFAQSVYATAEDYAKFMRLYLEKGSNNGGSILSEESVKRTFANRKVINVPPQVFPIAVNKQFAYGHYWGMAFDSISDEWPAIFLHHGTDGTGAYGFPEDQLIIIIMTQSRGSNLRHEIEKLIGETILPTIKSD